MNLKLLVVATILKATFTLGQTIYDTDWIASGSVSFDGFGWSMACVGDVNGDGFQDLVVGSPDHSEPFPEEEEEGKISLFYGGPDGLSLTPAWTYQSNSLTAVLGFDVSGGDLNGDGYSDIVAGLLQWSGDQIWEGKINFWYGGPDGPGDEPDWTYEGNQDTCLMGSSVALDGDINNDGYNDLLVAAKMYNNGQADEGKVWQFLGSPDGPVGPVWSYEPDQNYAIAGFPTSYAGDVNADGFDDVIIGVNSYTNTKTKQGMAVAFYGSADGLSLTPDWAAYGENAKDAFGHWADKAGDVNGDGFDDVVVTAISYETDITEANEGAAYVYYGSALGLNDAYSWKTEGNQQEANYGYCASGAGDINNDGFDDIVIGAKYYTDGEYKEGSGYVYFGSDEGPEINYCWFAEGGQDSAYMGRHVDGGADFNNDGYDDFLVSAYHATLVLEADGIVYCMYGGPREADFHFVNDSVCSNDINPIPVIEGLTGGFFSSTSGLVFVNTETGEIDLTASATGTYPVTYAYEGYCLVQHTQYISIGEPLYADFIYPNDTLFIGDSNPLPIFTSGSPGIFSASPAGLVFADINTGEINLLASIPGNYSITNSVSNTSCTIAFSTTITIENPCASPSTILLSSITESSATVSWENVSTAISYDVYFASTTDTSIFSNYADTSIYFSGLSEGIDYSCWVISNCPGISSSESDTLIFSTSQAGFTESYINSLLLFPNPANDIILFNLATTSSISSPVIKVMNAEGRIMPVVYTALSASSYSVSTAKLSSGIYTLMVIQDDFIAIDNFYIIH